MAETVERRAYREACKWHGVDGMCWERSSLQEFYDKQGQLIFRGHVNLDCDGECQRMEKYDKEHKEE